MALSPQELEAIRSLIVSPVVERIDNLKATIAERNDRQDTALADHEKRLQRVEGAIGKAMIVWGFIVSALTLGANLAWQKLRAWMGW